MMTETPAGKDVVRVLRDIPATRRSPIPVLEPDFAVSVIEAQAVSLYLDSLEARLTQVIDNIDNACGDQQCLTHIDADYLSHEDGYQRLAKSIIKQLKGMHDERA